MDAFSKPSELPTRRHTVKYVLSGSLRNVLHVVTSKLTGFIQVWEIIYYDWNELEYIR